MGHDFVAPLVTDGKGGPKLVLEQERMPVPIPGWPHDATREIELNVIHTVFDLVTDGLDEPIGAITLSGMS